MTEAGIDRFGHSRQNRPQKLAAQVEEPTPVHH